MSKPKVFQLLYPNMNCFLLAAVLASLVSIVSGINCHQCQTLAQKNCDDPLTLEEPDEILGECDDDYYCVKYKTVVWIRDSGYINGRQRSSAVVTRSCEQKKGKTEGCVGWQNNGGITIKCYCGSDGCNVGHSVTPKFLTSLACLFILVILRLFCGH